MKRALKFYTLNLGLTYSDITALYRWFRRALATAAPQDRRRNRE